ncbi:DUF262 domain-containing protein [Microbacterium sp. CFBP9034]|uniref:DUF262 domain-containing protein n=1 Tax=Microbacterium sp. CFBP9034 TaxID=3096540 RepID=UPI002A6ADE0F|nr:DUF262 domain-containing protein [Microbacterium sp. CFBP9034]MDY0910095.1 DUF262 domain-containing protein [Microbacterium sp. CFBP9034]
MSDLDGVPPRVSVEFLVQQWNQGLPAAEQWHLGLVQRDEVWKPTQREQLLDSLLKAYPIGSILLGRDRGVAETSIVFERLADGTRAEKEVSSETWQILDGQQRMSTLASIFSKGASGHMELDMVDPQAKPLWVSHDDERPPRVETRSQRVDLAGWVDFCARHDLSELSTVSGDVAQDLLAELDAEFMERLTGGRAEVALRRLAELASLWTEERVPVLAAPVRDPEQLLEVFQRVNGGGTIVSQADVYFAAVKTFWPHAESSLQRIVARLDGLLDKFSVLELISRLARVALGARDPVNVNVENLARAQGLVLRRALTELCVEDAMVVHRLETAARWLVNNSRLGWGLRTIHKRTLSAVLGWAASLPETVDCRAMMDANGAAIDAFLAGVTLHGYRAAFRARDRFDRVAFSEGVAAGVDGQPFPSTRIRDVLCFDAEEDQLARLPSMDTLESRLRAARMNESLILSVVQRWGFHAGELHIDHIYSSAASGYDMRIIGPYGRMVRHPLRASTINSLGNYWLLPGSTNESLGMRRPDVKFASLNTWLAEEGWPVPVRAQWSITEGESGEEASFLATQRDLVGSNDAVDAAMRRFQVLVTSRADRLINGCLADVPGSIDFARGRNQLRDTNRREIDDALATNLGTTALHAEFASLGGSRSRTLTPMLWHSPWAGREDEMARVWEAACGRRAKGSRVARRANDRDALARGFKYYRPVKIAPAADMWAWFGARSSVEANDPSPLAVMFNREHEAIDLVRRTLRASSLADLVPADSAEDILIPIEVDDSLPEHKVVDAVENVFDQIDMIFQIYGRAPA